MNPITPNARLVVGQRVSNNLYSRGLGIVFAIHGEQGPASVRRFHDAVVTGGSAHFDIVFEEGSQSLMLPEAVLRGGGWSVFDDVATQDEIDTARQFAAAEDIRRNEEDRLRTEKREARRQEAIEKHPHLRRVSDKESRYVTGAKNIRKELAAAFPGVKFSVRSDSYSGGNSIDVHWTDGPTSREVDAILDKYEEGRFDGMTDSYDYDRENVWPSLFGGAKYVHGSRSESPALREAIGRALCALQRVEYQGDNTRNLRGEHDDHWLSQHVWKVLCQHSIPPGATFLGVRSATADEDCWAVLEFNPPATIHPRY